MYILDSILRPVRLLAWFLLGGPLDLAQDLGVVLGSPKYNIDTCLFQISELPPTLYMWLYERFAGGTYTVVLEEVCQHSTERRWNLGW